MSTTGIAELEGVEAVQAEGQRLLKEQPPSGRDFQIYRQVTIQEVPTRVAAKKWGVSQTRVMQIVRRVEEYISAMGPQPSDKLQLNQRLFVIQYQASERIRHVVGQMMRALDATQLGTKLGKPTRRGMQPTLSTCADECRYATTIGRLSLMHAKLPGNAMVWEGVEEGDGGPGTGDGEEESGAVDRGAGFEEGSENSVERRAVEGHEGAEVVIVKCRGGEEEARKILEEMDIDVEEGELVEMPDEQEAEGEGEEEETLSSPVPAASPSEEACSPLLDEEAVQSVLATDPLDASDFLAELSAEEDLVAALRNGRRAGPVQKPIFAGVQEDVPSAATAELKAVAEERELTKRQRKELKRKLEMQKMLLRKLKNRPR